MSLEIQIVDVVTQSKRIDANIEALVVRLAQDKATDEARGRYNPDDEEQDALVALALTTVRQLLQEHRLIIKMLQELLPVPY